MLALRPIKSNKRHVAKHSNLTGSSALPTPNTGSFHPWRKIDTVVDHHLLRQLTEGELKCFTFFLPSSLFLIGSSIARPLQPEYSDPVIDRQAGVPV